jgi:hypothetical protein
MNGKPPLGKSRSSPENAAPGEMVWEPDDASIFTDVVARLDEEARAGWPPGELILAAGRCFLGAPYLDAGLEGAPERLVINLRSFDCFTFVEHAVVLAGLARQGRTAFPDYAAALQALRYRQGIIDGYPSRLHYFTDWIYENARRGIVKDMTRQLGGKPFRKRINYMTAHAGLYPVLKNKEAHRRMREVERRISRRVRHKIPQESVLTVERKIFDGDLIAILADESGLDCLHVGLAVHAGDRLHLLHASRRAGAVIVSPEALSDYLTTLPGHSGILVARMQAPE